MDSEQPPIRAVIFDLDGTLIDSLQDIADAGNRMLVRRGLQPIPTSEYPHFIGEGARKLVEGLLGSRSGEVTREVIKEALAEFRQEYSAGLIVRTRPYPQVPAMLRALAAAGVPIAVLSNKPNDWTRHIVGQLLPDTRFVEVYGQRTGVPRKPDPAAALELAAALGVPCDEVAFVGDTVVDMRTAGAAGMRAVAVAWGFASVDALRAAGASSVAEDVPALQGTLLGSACDPASIGPS